MAIKDKKLASFRTVSVDIYLFDSEQQEPFNISFRTVSVDIYLNKTKILLPPCRRFRTVSVDIYLGESSIIKKGGEFSYSIC